MSKIFGIGTDLVEIERIREAVTRHGESFAEKLFTEKERAYCQTHRDPIPRYAGRFAAKEAIVKALGVGFGKEAGFHDIEILANEDGKPEVFLSGSLKEEFFDHEILITITHSKDLAQAFAICQET